MSTHSFRDTLILPLGEHTPSFPDSVFVAPGVVLAGDIVVGEDTSFWYHTVVRADVGRVRIGARVNVQDHAMIHMTGGRSHTTIGDDVTIGHRAIIHGATIGDRTLIGMGAIILDNAIIPEDCVVGAGALVTGGQTFEPGTMILGSPAKAVRALKENERAMLPASAAHYVEAARAHREAIQKLG